MVLGRARNGGARRAQSSGIDHSKLPLTLALLLATVLVSLTACRVLDYRSVQSDFEQAVRADNAGSPFSRQHEDIVSRLTPEYIAKLDAKLRPNAWMLRAVSAWRAGLTNEIDKSASAGRADPNLVRGSRDDVVLAMIAALATDSDLQRRWLAARRTLTEAEYAATFEPGFKAAWRELADEAEASMNEKTPVDARAYYYYHRWRILLNWAAVIASIRPVAAAGAAQDRANASVNAPSLLEAAKGERDKIPGDHSLRALIRAQGGE